MKAMAEKRRSRALLWAVFGLAGFFVFLAALFTVAYYSVGSRSEYTYASDGSGGKIGVIDLTGVILTPKRTVDGLRKFADDSSIRAIIIHINSPGGGAAASEEIYREVKRIRDEKRKHIVASIETVGASGAYYVASATDKIYCNEASIVGSIGVIAEWLNYQELLRWAKLKAIVFKSGEFKDTGSPVRELTPQEKQYFQGLLDNMHQQFIHNVAEGRRQPETDISKIADGKVWTGQQALGLKLVDQLADFQGAVKDTASAVGISGKPMLVRYRKPRVSVLDLLVDDASEYLPDAGKLLQTNVGFYYLWK
jgi:protease-4